MKVTISFLIIIKCVCIRN